MQTTAFDAPPERSIFLSSAVTGSQLYNVPTRTGDAAAWENKGLQLAADNSGAGNFTGGNAANTLKVRIYYTIQAVP